MTPTPKAWKVRVTAVAEADFGQIVRWTASQFGARQARTYYRTLSLTVEALARGPDIMGARKRDDIAKGLHSLHVARAGRKGRHLLIFRVRREANQRNIEVLRVLHDAMDLPHQLPSEDPDNA